METYELKNGKILKNGHTMFLEDVVADLNRKAFLEDKHKALEDNIWSYYKQHAVDVDTYGAVVPMQAVVRGLYHINQPHLLK